MRKRLLLSVMALLVGFFSASNVFAYEADLQWKPPATNEDGSAVTDLTGYWLYYGTSSGYYSQKVDVGNVTAYRVANLSAGNTYYFAVTAYDATGNESVSSYEVSKKIDSPVDTTPPSIQIIDISNIIESGATVSWITDEPSTSQVQYGTTAAYGSSTTLNSSLVTSHSIVLSGLASSTDYHFRVSSSDSAGNNALSNDYAFKTSPPADTTAPTISGVSASNVSATSATISWTTNEPSTSQVEYGLSTSYGSLSSLASTPATSHSVAISSLQASSTYNFRVLSKDTSGNETRSANYTFSTSSSTSNAAPTFTSLAVSTSKGKNYLRVAFTAYASDSDGSIVKYEWDLNGDGQYEKSTTGNSVSYTYAADGTYTARVRVTDNAGAQATKDATFTVAKGKR